MEMAISQFKAKALSLMDQVHRDGQPITVLKRGKPLVKVIPADEPDDVQDLTGTILHQDEDIFSTGADWSADS